MIYFLSRAAAPVAAAGPSEADMKKLTAMVSPYPMQLSILRSLVTITQPLHYLMD